jgi:eukaryotic-like serine/threonine-protein kinase
MGLATGVRLGPYEVLSRLGAGGMGEVYRARDTRLGRDVAIKLLPGDFASDPERVRRLEHEARAAGQLNHPNIVAVFDVGVHEGSRFLVTELVEGGTLRAHLTGTAMAPRKALALGVQVVKGLAAAHEKGVVHRDIKPENLLMTRDGLVKILDFGLAKWEVPAGATLTSPAPSVGTMPGEILGTAGYMSPEQARGSDVDHRADIFAFGAVLYEMLSGTRAFAGSSPLEVIFAVIKDEPPDLSRIAPQVPHEVVTLVERCLEKDPARRFQSARDLALSIELLLSASGVPGGVATERLGARRRWRPSRRALLAATCTAGVAALGLAAYILGRGARPAELPFYRQITFRRGTVYTARFTRDGASVIYSAAWEGGLRELFATVPGSGDSRPYGLPETDVAAVLDGGELAVLHRSQVGFSPAMLALMPLAGGPAKDLLADVLWADCTADGGEVAVVKTSAGKYRLEYPAGTVVMESGGQLNYPRISPDGTRVAILEHPHGVTDAGSLVVVDRSGKRSVLAEGFKSIEGLAWRGDGREVWFTAAREGNSLWLWAVTERGGTRLLARVPGRLVLHDLSRDGRVVAERNSLRASIFGGTASDHHERDLSWLDFSRLGALSTDGRFVLLTEAGDGAGKHNVVFLRGTDGALPLRLGEGWGLALDPGAGHALLIAEGSPEHLQLVPVGPGRPVDLPPYGLADYGGAGFLPGGDRFVVSATQPGRGPGLFVQDIAGGKPRPISEPGSFTGAIAVSPDGHQVAATLAGKAVLVPLDGGAPVQVPHVPAGYVPIGWRADGRGLLLRDPEARAANIFALDLESGACTPFRQLVPADPAGLLSVTRVIVSPDGSSYAYQSYRLLSDLYIIENLR